jgi:hypothetical protein
LPVAANSAKRCAIKLANQMIIAVVVMDPGRVWKNNSGEPDTPPTTDCDFGSESLSMLDVLRGEQDRTKCRHNRYICETPVNRAFLTRRTRRLHTLQCSVAAPVRPSLQYHFAL